MGLPPPNNCQSLPLLSSAIPKLQFKFSSLYGVCNISTSHFNQLPLLGEVKVLHELENLHYHLPKQYMLTKEVGKLGSWYFTDTSFLYYS